MGCKSWSKAEKNYQKRLLITMSVYIVLVFLTTYFVRHMHVTGWLLYTLAVIPCLPILRMIHVVALYIAEETDEFKRLLVVRSLLGATALLLMVNAFSDFLRSYTTTGLFPPFMMFCVFWLGFGLIQGLQQMSYRVGRDEE